MFEKTIYTRIKLKTELIFFRSKQHPLNYADITIKFDGIKLTPVDYVKYLGIFIDKYLSWNYYMQLSKKSSIAIGILSKLRYNAPIETCLHVYYAIFYSHLTYGCNVCGLTSNKNLNEIEILQRKCIRIITDSDFRSPTNHLFIRHKILKVCEILDLNQLQLAFNFWINPYQVILTTCLSLMMKSILVILDSIFIFLLLTHLFIESIRLSSIVLTCGIRLG